MLGLSRFNRKMFLYFFGFYLLVFLGVSSAGNHTIFNATYFSNVEKEFNENRIDFSDGRESIDFISNYDSDGTLVVSSLFFTSSHTVAFKDKTTNRTITAQDCGILPVYQIDGRSKGIYVQKGQKITIEISGPPVWSDSLFCFTVEFFADDPHAVQDLIWQKGAYDTAFKQAKQMNRLNIMAYANEINEGINRMTSTVAVAHLFASNVIASPKVNKGTGLIQKGEFEAARKFVTSDAVRNINSIQQFATGYNVTPEEFNLTASNISEVVDGLVTLADLAFTGNFVGAMEAITSKFVTAAIYGFGVYKLGVGSDVNEHANAALLADWVLHRHDTYDSINRRSRNELFILADQEARNSEVQFDCRGFSNVFNDCGLSEYDEEKLYNIYNGYFDVIEQAVSYKKAIGNPYPDMDYDGILNAQDVRPNDPDVKIGEIEAEITSSTTLGNVGAEISLNGIAKDQDGNEIDAQYKWILDKSTPSKAVLTNSDSSKTSFTPDLPGSYTIVLRVSDGKSNAESKIIIKAEKTYDLSPIQLEPEKITGPISGEANSERYYPIQITASQNVARLDISLLGYSKANRDADIYVSYNKKPSVKLVEYYNGNTIPEIDADYEDSDHNQKDEHIEIPNPEPGTYWVLLYGYMSAYSGIDLYYQINTGVNDSDGDGVPDDQDAFPNDKNEAYDSDGDGVGDNADAFPNDSKRWDNVKPVIDPLSKTEISQLYVAIFNRASEGEGNLYWQSLGLDMATTADVMLETDAAKNYFGNSLASNQAFIEHIYFNTLNKKLAQDPVGIAYWVGLLDGLTSRGSVVANLVSVIEDYAVGGPNYDPSDAATIAAYNQFTNRKIISDYMADNVENPPVDWETSTSFNNGLVVTDDPATVADVKRTVERFNSPPPPIELSRTVVDLQPGESSTITISGGSGNLNVVNSNTQVVAASVSGKNLVITGLSEGNITLVITDAGVGSANVEVSVILSPDLTNYSENFSTDPNYVQHISSNAGNCEVKWTGDGYYARVYDQNSDWWCLGHSPAFIPFSTDEDFTVEFDFNPVDMDWGHYPGISFHGSAIKNKTGLHTNNNNGTLFRFVVSYSDGEYKKLRFLFSDSSGNTAKSYSTNTVPAENEWYRVTIVYHSATSTADLKVLRENGSAFYEKKGVAAPISGIFNYLSIGEVGSGPAYGNKSEIMVDNIMIDTISVDPGNTETGFKVSSTTSKYGSDHNQICVNEFGSGWEEADWTDLEKYYSDGGNMFDFISNSGINTRKNAWVTLNGNQSYSSTRDYLASYHNHSRPDNYLAHDNIDNHLLSLGSWDGSYFVLCKGSLTQDPGKPNDPTPPFDVTGKWQYTAKYAGCNKEATGELIISQASYSYSGQNWHHDCSITDGFSENAAISISVQESQSGFQAAVQKVYDNYYGAGSFTVLVTKYTTTRIDIEFHDNRDGSLELMTLIRISG